MIKIQLRNNKTFSSDTGQSIFEASKKSGLTLEHSCLAARCRSCVARVLEGRTERLSEDLVLSDEDIKNGYVLTCNSTALSNLKLDIEDLDSVFIPIKTVPTKIDSIEFMTGSVVRVFLRTPPNNRVDFVSGQYLNIIKGDVKRSYSLANTKRSDGRLEFFIKKYESGQMSQYFFENAKVDDLLRVEGPLGTFFYRKSEIQNIIFLGTGTGIAPIKSILDDFEANPHLVKNKKIYVFNGARHHEDLFWKPEYKSIEVNYIPVLSRQDSVWTGARGYVQEVVVQENIDLSNSQVYACGSNDMINAAFELLQANGLAESNFHSDAFVPSL
jgi:CDP-4-dehydro-6-deoxyglucose reductase